jgi:hypothetical protein
MAGLNHQACGELDPRIGHPRPRAHSFQNIPSRMKNPTSVKSTARLLSWVDRTSLSQPSTVAFDPKVTSALWAAMLKPILPCG